MKSVAEYPEYQGDPDNIQFLTRDEHLEAHKGSWQNPTNWYYNPETKEFVDFGENKPIPCEVINLSEPMRSPTVEAQESSNRQVNSYQSESEEPTGQSKPLQQEKDSHYTENTSYRRAGVTPPLEVHESFGDKILHAVDAVKEFGDKHPIIAGIVKWGSAAAIVIGTAAVANSNSSGSGSSGNGSTEWEDSSCAPI